MGKNERDLGATMLEFAIVAVTFLTTLFALIDFGVVIYTRSSASGAAQRALSWMSVQPGLANPGAHSMLKEQAAKRARDYMLSATAARDLTAVNPPAAPPSDRGASYILEPAQFIIPSDPSVAEGLKRSPLRVRVTFGYNPLLAFFLPDRMYFEVVASGFAERLPSEIEPMLVDCSGKRLTPDELPKKIFDPEKKQCVCRDVFQTQGDECICAPCPKGQEADEDSCLCSCPKGMELVDGACTSTCAGNRVRDPLTSECRCALTISSCQPPAKFDEPNCRCSTQACPPGMIMESNTCVCDENAPARKIACNEQGKVWDPLLCDCGEMCREGRYARDEGCYACGARQISAGSKCVCPPGTDNYPIRGCGCPYSIRDECNSRGRTLNFSTCTCGGGCAKSKVASDDACVCSDAAVAACTAQRLTINNDDCSCSDECEGLQRLSKGKCICLVANRNFCNSAGKVMNELCECESCPEGRYYEEGRCVCDPQTRVACNALNRIFDSVKCECLETCPPGKRANGRLCVNCPPEATFVGKNCKCPGGQVLKGNACVCPAAAKRMCEELGHAMDPLSCRCSCVGEACCSKTADQCATRGQVLNVDACRCEGCPPGTIFYGGRCSKPE